MEEDVEQLCRAATNYLFLGQFEALRAALLSLRRRQPEVARAILSKIVFEGGRINGILWSKTGSSSAHLAWFSAIELLQFPSSSPERRFDPETLRLKAECLLILDLLSSWISELDDKEDGHDRISRTLDILRSISDLITRELKIELASEVQEGTGEGFSFSDEELKGLCEILLDQSELLDVLCLNIHQLIKRSKNDSNLAISLSGSAYSVAEGIENLVGIPGNVQMAHLKVLNECLEADDFAGAIYHLRFLHMDFGVEDHEYRMALHHLIKKSSFCKDGNAVWNAGMSDVLLMYTEALASTSSEIVHLIQVVQDEIYQKEIEIHKLSGGHSLHLPLQKYLAALSSAKSAKLDTENFRNSAARSAKKELYHYARISKLHVLGCVMDTALYLIEREQLQDASDVLDLYPLLQPLSCVMGWDLLLGKTAVRRKLLNILWTSRLDILRLEGLSVRNKQLDEIDSMEYLCDLLCFRLDLASFVACVNSGGCWDSRSSSLLRESGKAMTEDKDYSDEFVENLVLERLSLHTPMRVLFDIVPGIKFKDAIELIRLQPLPSKTAVWRRLQDAELIHMRYCLESTLHALGTMEKGTDGEINEYGAALLHLKDLKNHLEAISTVPRKIFMLSILTMVLRMDDLAYSTNSGWHPSYSAALEPTKLLHKDGNNMVVRFAQMLLDTLYDNLQICALETLGDGEISTGTRRALEWSISNIKGFIEDWKWRLSVLQRLLPLSGQHWNWKEALVIFRAAPSKLLNLCMQQARFDIGKEAVHNFSLPPEDRLVLELAEWVTRTARRVPLEWRSNATEGLNLSSFHSELGSIRMILLCVDAAVSSSSTNKCRFLLNKARGMLSDIFPGGTPKSGSGYWNQIQEVTLIMAIKRVLQRLHDLLEQDKGLVPLDIFSGRAITSVEPKRQGQRRHALSMLNQMVDDAYKGKRQFLSGKLHNLSRAVADEMADFNRKKSLGVEAVTVLGLGLKPPSSISGKNNTEASVDHLKGSRISLFETTLSSKLSTYLSAFIIYIATIGDIVDGIDTTHDFNFFSLIYEWPKDLLIRLVFERGITDAAAKVADIMGVDFVHEVISACVPPVFPPRSGHGWACVPVLDCSSSGDLDINVPIQAYDSSPAETSPSLYPLKLDIVKHLVKLSPVRAILGCVFGSSILSRNSDLSTPKGGSLQVPDAERLFYEFALDQSERFATLNRWIQMQSNLHRVSESAKAAVSSYEIASGISEQKISVKRRRDSESDTELETVYYSDFSSELHVQLDKASDYVEESPKSDGIDIDPGMFLSLDWDNEGPYEKAVERLIEDGKLMDALALSDRFLCCGASDRLLQLLIEREEENSPVFEFPLVSAQHFVDDSWQYCLRLKDKDLAARLALKHLRRWDFDAAMDVLLMCSCHLPSDSLLRNEIFQRKQALQCYKLILSADDHYSCWQEVEDYFKGDPEGLALRLAGKGAVSAALEVADNAALSIDLKRELQGQQLVKLLTSDPLNGGGPAEAARFLSSLSHPDDAFPVAIGAMQLLPDLRSKQLLVHFFLKRRAGNMSELGFTRLNLWAMGLKVLAVLPSPWQQKCSALHEHPHLIVEVLLMMKHLQYASMILKKFTSLCDDNLILTYAEKAIAVNVNTTPREPRTTVAPRSNQKSRAAVNRASFTSSLSNLQVAYKALSWSRDSPSKSSPKEFIHKRKSLHMSSDRVSWEATTGTNTEQVSSHSTDVQERSAFVSATNEWILTGDASKDAALRSSHKYESAPDIILFKELLSLCSSELISARGALNLCITQMKKVLSSQMLPLDASMETIGQAYNGTETFVQALTYAKNQLRKLAGIDDLSINAERHRDNEDESSDAGSSCRSSQYSDEVSELTTLADLWLGRAEVLQSLLGSEIIASLDDIADTESSAQLRDRLIRNEHYSMAVYTCKKCKIDAFPVWNAWGHALLRIEQYAQARVKFRQALQLYKRDPVPIVDDILNTMEAGPPVDVSSVRSMYEHLAKSAATILDDSLSADAYLNVLYMPSTFPRSERSRQSARSASSQLISDSEDGPRSNLDNNRFLECKYYLQEFAQPKMLNFLFRHGHYLDACTLFFPPNSVPSFSQPSSLQRSDPLATDYGTFDELCYLCIGYGAMAVLEGVLSERHAKIPEDSAARHYILAALVRICSYCETHRHFNYLYKFQVIRGDHVASGLCCIQLFMNSTTQDEAIRHLEHAKIHFDEGHKAQGTRQKAVDATKFVPKVSRRKSASEKFTQGDLLKLSAVVAIQVDVVKTFNDTEKHPWKHSLFGNPNDPDTFWRRSKIAEKLAEKNFDLAFRVIHEFILPAADIYAAVAASLAERKRGGQLTELLKNIKNLSNEEDWDQVVGAAINVYANKHKERPDRLIDMLISSHRKVLACVICGRLKSAFQIASRSGSVADVEYVAHQALHANALPVLDMCKQWLAQYM